MHTVNVVSAAFVSVITDTAAVIMTAAAITTST